MIFEILTFLLQVVAGSLSSLLLVRAYMRWRHISFLGKFGQFITATTNWLVSPLQKLFPVRGKLDIVSLLCAWIVQVLLLALSLLLSQLLFGGVFGVSVTTILFLPIAGFVQLLEAALYLVSGLIILGAILSWVNPYSPIVPFINTATEPFLSPLRKRLPALAGVDISPLIAIVIIQLLQIILSRAYAVLSTALS